MKIQTTIMFGIILSLTLVSAITSAIYSGDCDTIEFPNIDPVNWSVDGNSSNMDGFSYTKTNYTIKYCFHILYKPDNFTITFYNYQEVEIKSSGSHCKPAIDYNWNCSLWSICSDGEQTRTCDEHNNCGNDWGRPKTNQTCFEISATNDNVINEVINDTIVDEPVDTLIDESKTIWRVIWENIPLILIILIMLTVAYRLFFHKLEAGQQINHFFM